jgi:hypothetical protein
MPRASSALPRAFSILRVLSGPVLTGAGAAVGFVLGGTTGAFFGNPTGPLGFAIGYQQRTGTGGDWGGWRATFIAGWMATWVGEVAAVFGTKLVPVGSPLSLSYSGISLRMPVAQLLAVTAGIIAAVLARNGGVLVSRLSDIDIATSMAFSLFVWLAGMSVFAIYETSFASFESWVLLAAGRGPAPLPGEFIAVVPVAVAASLSLFLGALAIPRVLAWKGQSREVDTTPGGTPPRTYVYLGVFGVAVVGIVIGSTLGALLALTYFAGLSASVPPWPIPEVYIGLCAALGILATALATRWSKKNRDRTSNLGQTSKSFYETVGEATFGMVVGGSLTTLIFLAALVPAGQVGWAVEARGAVVGGLLFVVVLGAAFFSFRPIPLNLTSSA